MHLPGAVGCDYTWFVVKSWIVWSPGPLLFFCDAVVYLLSLEHSVLWSWCAEAGLVGTVNSFF